MGREETVQEREKRFAKIWSSSRSNAGKTQEFMANGLGVSRKTIQNWENGVTAPDLFMGSEWFHILGINPLPYYLSFLFPDLFSNGPEENDKTVDEALTFLINNMTGTEKRELLYLMSGQHGSPWYSLLQLFTAHCHTSLRARVSTARLILDNYEMEAAAGALVCPESVRPDLPMLRNAVEQGKLSAMNGSGGYTNVTQTASSVKEEEQ